MRSFGQHRLTELPDNYTRCDADVERVLCAKLRYLQAIIGHVDHMLLNSFHFVAKDDGVFGIRR